MQTILICLFAAIVSCACAQVPRPGYAEKHPVYYKQVRQPRDITWDKKIDNGRVFGTLGNDDEGLFGKAGYEKQFFNDDRGKLTAQAYGARVLGPAGDSTRFGGNLDWSNDNAKAAVDVSRQMGGPTSLKATGSGLWNFDKDTRLSAGGFLTQEHLGHGRPDVGVQAQFQHDW